LINLKRALYATTWGLVLHEPVLHFCNGAKLLNHFYEWPQNRQETNIFFREVFRIPGFWKELSKKLTFGFFQAGVDTGAKLASW